MVTKRRHLQQAFNATAVIRHMRRLQLGSSLGSSMDNTVHRTENQAPMPIKSQSIDVSSINHKDCKLTSDIFLRSGHDVGHDTAVVVFLL